MESDKKIEDYIHGDCESVLEKKLISSVNGFKEKNFTIKYCPKCEIYMYLSKGFGIISVNHGDVVKEIYYKHRFSDKK